ncbi:MAG: DUF4260 domain-containing protein [Beijerinckiaceae bacterium]
MNKLAKPLPHDRTPEGARPRWTGHSTGAVSGAVRMILRLEGLAVCLAALATYALAGFSWQRFAILFLIPDISFTGYLAGPRLGAVIYNLAHNYAGALVLAIAGYSSGNQLAATMALIWIAHIGFDRALGYGLKYATSFDDTHLGLVGRPSRARTAPGS